MGRQVSSGQKLECSLVYRGSFSLGKYTKIFQAEMYAIKASGTKTESSVFYQTVKQQ
jgi:hypothetical protein